MKNIQLTIRILSIFWGIVLFSILIKALVDYIPKQNWNITKEQQINKRESLHNTDVLYFPLKPRYGFILKGYKGCIKNSRAAIHKEGYNFYTKGSCWNNNCSIQILFNEKIPKDIDLFIKQGDTCITKNFIVPKVLDTLSYYVDLQLSQSQKQKLGIKKRDKIRLEHANGYSLSGSKQYYFYDTPRDKDNIVVNDTIVGEVFFNKSASHEQTTQTHKDEVKKEEVEIDIDIPHPKELYTFTCNSDMLCQKEANTYIVNVDGVDFIPSKEFIFTCLSNKQSNKFCTFFTPLGHRESIQFNSTNMMNSYIRGSKNPEFNDSFKEWEQKRLEKAKEKIEKSL